MLSCLCIYYAAGTRMLLLGGWMCRMAQNTYYEIWLSFLYRMVSARPEYLCILYVQKQWYYLNLAKRSGIFSVETKISVFSTHIVHFLPKILMFITCFSSSYDVAVFSSLNAKGTIILARENFLSYYLSAMCYFFFL